MKIDSGLITLIAEDLAPYKDDLETFWDTLDGETDIMDAVGSLIEALVEADANEDALTVIIDRYSVRRDAMRQRREKIKRSLKRVLEATGQDKIPHPLATISLRSGFESVVITDEKEIPTQLCKVTITPDKTEIKKQLKAGVNIDGCELHTGPQTISIRMK